MSEDWAGCGSHLADISDDPNPTKNGPACLDVANIGYGIGCLDHEDGCALVAKAIRAFEAAEIEQDAMRGITAQQIVYRNAPRTGSRKAAFLDSFVRVL